MEIQTIYLFLVIGLSVADDPSCAIWKKNLDILNANNGRQSWSESGMSFRCKYHPEKCEQIDCVGMFRNAMIGSFSFCWNMIMNHCDSPINMDVSISIDSFNYKFSQRVTHNQRYPLSIQSQNLSLSGIPIHEYLEFTLLKINATAVMLGMKLSTEMCIPHLGCTFNKKIDLLPDIAVPVSRCSKVTRTPVPKAPKCSNGGKTGGGGSKIKPYFTTTKMPPHTTYKSRTYGKKCSMNSLASRCGRNEMCKQGRCACFTPKYPRCPYTGVCQTLDDCAKHIVPVYEVNTVSPHTGHQNNGDSPGPTNKTAVIVGGALGGIVVIVIVVGIILVMLKKRGSQYRGRQLLLTEDNTDGII
ncbi:uncharacterized protein LOC125661655 [Ostrea edulis]|uniref:uncharacterized protein LOC125661655 n=1 Tax=Ostrea edulis TaxID=37623 RepID=UPI002094C707|nr:uncharacterized protein LOC125661655 [Ostrea edulis]